MPSLGISLRRIRRRQNCLMHTLHISYTRAFQGDHRKRTKMKLHLLRVVVLFNASWNRTLRIRSLNLNNAPARPIDLALEDLRQPQVRQPDVPCHRSWRELNQIQYTHCILDTEGDTGSCTSIGCRTVKPTWRQRPLLMYNTGRGRSEGKTRGSTDLRDASGVSRALAHGHY